jgi:hypothetical protein
MKTKEDKMEVELAISDRFALLGILPQEGNFATLKIVRELREQLSLTEQEIKEYNVQQLGDQITWNNGIATTSMSFSAFAVDMIQKALKKLNDEEKLEERHFNIYEQFIGE